MKIRYGHSGVHLFDRKTGLNVLLDETRPPVREWSQAPRYVSLALTNACELSCPYCYASKAPSKLSPNAIITWAKELDRHGCFGIGLGGGEPTLYPEFSRLCEELNHSTQLAITLTTHGHRFSKQLASQLRGNVQFIRLSMDGIEKTYEKLRGRSFAAFLQKLALVRDTAPFGINFVVNEETLGELELAAEFAFENGASEFLVLPQSNDQGRVVLSESDQEKIANWINEKQSTYRIATSSTADFADRVIRLFPSNKNYESYDFMHLDAFGTLKLSAFSREGIKIAEGDSILDAILTLRQQSHENWEVVR